MAAKLSAIVVLIFFSAFFSSSESAYASCSELRLRRAAENDGSRRSKWAYWIYMHYPDAVTTLLIGNNLVNTAASSLATLIVITALGSGYAWAATLVITVVTLIFGEIVPKVAAREMAESYATAVAPPLRALMLVTKPLAAAVGWFIGLIARHLPGGTRQTDGVTEDDIEILLGTAESEGAIDVNTSNLLQSALDFDDVLAYQIITPRVDMLCVDIGDCAETIVAAVLTSHYSRLPVYEGSKDNIVGVLHLNRFMKSIVGREATREDVEKALLPVYHVARTAPLPAVLATMRRQNCHLVVVCDEYGGTLGILTMEDILEELVGDIWDETDEIGRAITMLPDGRMEASGSIRLQDFFEALDMPFDDTGVESATLGGWAAERLGAYPREGEFFTLDGLRFTVGLVQKRRVMHVLVEKIATGKNGATVV